MTHAAQPRLANALPVRNVPQEALLRLDLEPFHVAAEPQLSACPMGETGICRNPFCSARFVPVRPHQLYCSAACRKSDDQEFRAVGLRAAPALLAWQMGRYAPKGTALADLSRAGRNYYSALAAQWLRDRRRRMHLAEELR
ncbi:hypothetical protein TG4357_03725 [Thalassovita gelatinovora]|uniref:Uncharacterized protein n=1 Tax=Thalassovita gelatinovora TaxID=53501 RepID=A0A0P1G5B7_THAGE|nr:hypothetical protein [Thalassovita gelatinovora]QIZ79059.1 hypothetical protein HFZ77_00500 [Thalassovita gelatinovora]CUH68662.1 hypothetical protein TG4357_03725 [Thalassovita gelatinovora]SEQ56299.1 hypothetical protein SAMN04488043_106186 [Thalassovita gelatinovora]